MTLSIVTVLRSPTNIPSRTSKYVHVLQYLVLLRYEDEPRPTVIEETLGYVTDCQTFT